jgi:hypothetical protein
VCVESKAAECTKKDPCKILAMSAKFLPSRRYYSRVFRHRNSEKLQYQNQNFAVSYVRNFGSGTVVTAGTHCCIALYPEKLLSSNFGSLEVVDSFGFEELVLQGVIFLGLSLRDLSARKNINLLSSNTDAKTKEYSRTCLKTCLQSGMRLRRHKIAHGFDLSAGSRMDRCDPIRHKD